MKDRKEILRKLLKKHDLDIILVYSCWNDYAFSKALTGKIPLLFNYFFITEKEEGFFEIDYLIDNKKQIPLDEEDPGKELGEFLKKYKKIGLVGNAPWWHVKNIQAINLNDEALEILNTKTNEEIEKIRISAEKILYSLEKIKKFIIPGRTQIEIERKLKEYFEGNNLAFPVCITSGKKIKETTASIPNEEQIKKEDIVAIDAGISVDGFYSDCTRMYFLENSEAEKNYNKLTEVHHEVIKKIMPGIFLKKIPELYREELKKRNMPDTLIEKDLGHSIGFSVHEPPFIYNEDYENFKLVEGMVITLEPEIVFSNYRLRIEDMIAIKKTGSEILTKLANF